MKRLILLTLLFAASCSKPRVITPAEGFVNVPGGKVWYRIAGSGSATPLLLLHGGPGFPSDYLARLSELSDERYDEATPETTAFYQSQIPGSQLVIFENSAHMTMLEETDRYVQVVRDFLHKVER